MDIPVYRYNMVAPDRIRNDMQRVVVPKGKPLEVFSRYPAHGIKDETYTGNTGECGCTDNHEPHDAL